MRPGGRPAWSSRSEDEKRIVTSAKEANVTVAGEELERLDAFWRAHLAAGGETTWCRFARAIVARAAVAGLIPREIEVAAISTAEFPTKAQRPAYSVLDTSKLRGQFGVTSPEWTRGLDAVIGELAEQHG